MIKELEWALMPVEELQEIVSGYLTSVNRVHVLKTLEPHFSEVWNEAQTAELRDCSDRDFKIGDVLVLRQWLVPNMNSSYWGLYGIVCRVTSILRPDQIDKLFAGEGRLVICEGVTFTPAPPISMLSFQLLDKFKLSAVALDLDFPLSDQLTPPFTS